ncbi:hypothetical protein AVEN_14919-1 [Araneus ventricosus]|uniref:Uncharacterized protein n=1 Tax=Araneus ventricosus TaxID=182803 RepID=A0A4Y2JPH7_ARAVE|nr:hypothetical protein AVEN_14919-1 [Araneus ventricosus]
MLAIIAEIINLEVHSEVSLRKHFVLFMKRKAYKHFYAIIRIREKIFLQVSEKLHKDFPTLLFVLTIRNSIVTANEFLPTTCEPIYCKAYHHESVTVNQVINGGESRGEKARICRLRLQKSNQEKTGCSHIQGNRTRREITVLRNSA